MSTDKYKIFLEACKNGDLVALEKFTDVNPAFVTSDGVSPLMIAARFGKAAVCSHLIKRGVPVDLPDKATSKTALFYAVRHNGRETETVKTLLEGGANPNFRNKYAETPVMIAAQFANSGSSPAIIEVLLKAGANPNHQCNDGWTALMSAARNSKGDSCEEAVKMLLQGGADPNIQDLQGMTALTLALRFYEDSTDGTLLYLFKAGSNINIRCKRGNSPLQWAALFSSDGVVKLMIRNGATWTEEDLEKSIHLKKLVSVI